MCPRNHFNESRHKFVSRETVFRGLTLLLNNFVSDSADWFESKVLTLRSALPPPPPPPPPPLAYPQSQYLTLRLWTSYIRLDCKTVRIIAYSNTHKQSNKRSRTRLKTESETRGNLTPRFTDFLTDFEKKKKRLFCSLISDRYSACFGTETTMVRAIVHT